MKPTLFKHIFRTQMRSIFLVSLFFFGIIMVFNFAEASRKTSITNLDNFLLILKAVSFGALETFSEITHYVYFITATFCLWQLCKSQQMIILKSSGQSPLQILYPFISCAITIASFWLFILQPAGILGGQKYREVMSNSIEEGCNEDIWLDYPGSNRLMFIKKLNGRYAYDLYIFEENSAIISDNAVINKQDMTLKNGVEIADNHATSFKYWPYDNYINDELIEIVSSPAQKQSIYGLYQVYKVEQESGVSLKTYEIALQKLLVNCFTFVLFALIAAVICFPINRYNSKTSIGVKIIVIAIGIRFLNNIFEAMAYTGVLSPFVAIWIVVLFSLCISIAILIWREV